ncbi:MAG: formate dehydrogenase subunit gamma [Hyphomicrobiaceae bacterium]
MKVFSLARPVAAALLGAAIVLSAGAASAQQPKSVNPTASSVQEKQLLEALKPGGPPALSGRVSIPDQQSGNLIQPAGKDWRAFHQRDLPRIGTYVILGSIALIALFFMIRGRIRIPGGPSGQLINRFGSVDRFAHWTTATSFILLALTGLNVTFGKQVVLPIIGPEAFTVLSQFGKYVHNYVSFAFVLGITLMFLLWTKDNIPGPRDIKWILKGGGLIGMGHPEADRFNGGQKAIFWSTILGGAALAVTGYILMFPFQFTDIAGQQLANIVHGIAGVILVAIIIAHIYIGSLGMEGAFAAMGSGKVDVSWAREHHSVWVDKVARRSGTAIPAE